MPLPPCTACPDAQPTHLPGDRVCYATRRGFELLKDGMRPFPQGHSIPAWFPLHKAATRIGYDGEPRDAQPLLVMPEPQLWGPFWLDIIIELWAGPIDIDPMPMLRENQRNEVIQVVVTSFTSSMKLAIVDARREDLRAVRELLKTWIKGPAPMLIEEVEGARHSVS